MGDWRAVSVGRTMEPSLKKGLFLSEGYLDGYVYLGLSRSLSENWDFPEESVEERERGEEEGRRRQERRGYLRF
jgi:hypothetical protein